MDAAAAQDLLDRAVAEHEVPGAQLGLLRGEERLVLCAGSLEPGGEPVTAGSAFHAGSLAKSLAGLVVLDAARDGRLDLDAPCSDQAPGLWSDTPRALLSQTTGRANVLPEYDEALDAFVTRVADLPLVHEPGRFSYCNAGWSVLDLVLERTTGRGFEASVHAALGEATTFAAPPGATSGFLTVPGRPPIPVPAMYAPAAAAAGSTWWATADQLLDLGAMHLGRVEGPFHPDDVAALRAPHAGLPGATVFDSWGLGWAVWDRGTHQAFGWAGYTGGHRAYLRCFPDQDAAVVLLANGAGPLFGPPGGSAVFDALLPDALDLLGVPALPDPEYPAARRPAADLAGDFGPIGVMVADDDRLALTAPPFGQLEPVVMERLGGNTFTVVGSPPGSTPVAFEADLLYVGPFAVPRG